MNHDAETIRRLVAEVIGRLQSELPPRPDAGSPSPPTGAKPGLPQHETGPRLGDAVITLATVERLPAGAKRVSIAARAVITPSAREYARDQGIEFVRLSQATPTATAPRPFLVAHAECGSDVTSRCAAIARGIAGSQQLPATGLADVLAALVTHVTRDGGRGLLLCGRPATAVVLANRTAGVRAITAREPASLLAAIAECGANLLVVDPRAFSAASLDRLGGDFARRDSGPVPAELSGGPSPCSCKGHAH